MTDQKLIDDVVTAFADRDLDAPSRDDIARVLEVFETSLRRCGCDACTTARQERIGLTEHDITSLARVLHEVVYSPGASFDRAVPGIQEYMRACAEKVAAALPWVVPTPEVEVTLGEVRATIGSINYGAFLDKISETDVYVDEKSDDHIVIDGWTSRDALVDAILAAVEGQVPIDDMLPGPTDAARVHLGEWRERRHTPNDDEREALDYAIRCAIPTDLDYRPLWKLIQSIKESVLAAGFRRSEVPEPSAKLCDQCAGPHPDEWLKEYGGHWDTCPNRLVVEPQGEPSDARVEEANSILARIVSAANKGPLEGEDGFILGYQMAPGPIHAAIPFLQKQGIVVTTSGEIRTAVTEQGEPSRGA